MRVAATAYGQTAAVHAYVFTNVDERHQAMDDIYREPSQAMAKSSVTARSKVRYS